MTLLHNHYRNILSVLSIGIAVGFCGCATSGQQIRDPQRAGVWKVRLPASTGVYGLGTAGGTSDDAIAAVRPVTNIDEYLKPEYAKASAQKAQHMSERRLIEQTYKPMTTVVAAKAAPTPVVAPVMTPVAAPLVAPLVAPPAAPSAQPEQYAMRSEPRPDDLQRYAERDSRSQQEQSFRGGDVVVISVSTLLIIGLIILLIILLT